MVLKAHVLRLLGGTKNAASTDGVHPLPDAASVIKFNDVGFVMAVGAESGLLRIEATHLTMQQRAQVLHTLETDLATASHAFPLASEFKAVVRRLGADEKGRNPEIEDHYVIEGPVRSSRHAELLREEGRRVNALISEGAFIACGVSLTTEQEQHHDNARGAAR